jgi:hypothetical protein
MLNLMIIAFLREENKEIIEKISYLLRNYWLKEEIVEKID